MPDSSDLHNFPQLNTKLAAPSKKSLFERQKAEAEAKRQREEAETAAVLQDFVKSFEDDDDGFSTRPSAFRSDNPGFERSSGPPKRHYTGPPGGGRSAIGGARVGIPISGPGSLGPFPPSLSKKRPHDGDYEGPLRKPDVAAVAVFQASDDEDETSREIADKAAPKPTIQLSSLPPGVSMAVIRALIPSGLNVDNIRIAPTMSSSSNERRSTSAIVTFAKDTPASDIDATVNLLQNRYMGWGYRLVLSRYLSSAALNVGGPTPVGRSSNTSNLPFGAKTAPLAPLGSMNRAPPPASIHRGGYAPPTTYSTPNTGQPQVTVKPPSDLKQVRLIHMTVESVINHGPAFEALLMSRPEVQTEERWSWIWDARSDGGVWYRWRLWEIMSGLCQRSIKSRAPVPYEVFDNGPPWVAPAKPLRFQYSTKLESFISDSEYDSSEDDASDDESHNRPGLRDNPNLTDLNAIGTNQGDEKAYLSPFHKAKLAFLLARLPTSISKLRKGDVARVTAFAVRRAGEGASEVVEMIVANVLHPFAHTSANPEREDEDAGGDEAGSDAENQEKEADAPVDRSTTQLVGLYIISDILSCSSTSGVRHAWKYRQLFEAALGSHQVFETLGRLEKSLKWGRLRAEKWRRAVGALLSLWEGWCVFPAKAHGRLVQGFQDPPLSGAERAEVEKREKDEAKAKEKRWKAVDGAARPTPAAGPGAYSVGAEDVDGEAMDDDLDEQEMDENLDGASMEESDDDPMDDDTDRHAGLNLAEANIANDRDGLEGDEIKDGNAEGSANFKEVPRNRQRPRAEDMFADSDSN
ncbi:MAG: hypothetical protein M1814_005352 [Vezdaea aestivalis]|nr:MAG: hypothetical protein M1814_005352 [Vezdaea aestivalis]